MGIKGYLYIFAAVSLFYSGWAVNGWRYKAMETSALKTVITESNKQVKKDVKVIAKASESKEIIKIKYRTIIKKVPYAKNNCTIPAGSDFTKLWNSSGRLLD